MGNGRHPKCRSSQRKCWGVRGRGAQLRDLSQAQDVQRGRPRGWGESRRKPVWRNLNLKPESCYLQGQPQSRCWLPPKEVRGHDHRTGVSPRGLVVLPGPLGVTRLVENTGVRVLGGHSRFYSKRSPGWAQGPQRQEAGGYKNTSRSRNFPSSPTETLSPFKTHSPSPAHTPQPLTPTVLLSVFMNLTPLGTSQKWHLRNLSFASALFHWESQAQDSPTW